MKNEWISIEEPISLKMRRCLQVRFVLGRRADELRGVYVRLPRLLVPGEPDAESTGRHCEAEREGGPGGGKEEEANMMHIETVLDTSLPEMSGEPAVSEESEGPISGSRKRRYRRSERSEFFPETAPEDLGRENKRVVCAGCRRIMRYEPLGGELRRRVPPHGEKCVGCPVTRRCTEPACPQCRHVR